VYITEKKLSQISHHYIICSKSQDTITTSCDDDYKTAKFSLTSEIHSWNA